MQVMLELFDGRTLKCTVPHDKSDHVEVPGRHCECSMDEDLHVSGGPEVRTESTSEAPAYCARCRGPIGTLRVVFDTIWGATEDAAVLTHGRCRVYGGYTMGASDGE